MEEKGENKRGAKRETGTPGPPLIACGCGHTPSRLRSIARRVSHCGSRQTAGAGLPVGFVRGAANDAGAALPRSYLRALLTIHHLRGVGNGSAASADRHRLWFLFRHGRATGFRGARSYRAPRNSQKGRVLEQVPEELVVDLVMELNLLRFHDGAE